MNDKEYGTFCTLLENHAEYPENGFTYLWDYDNTQLSYNKEGNLEDFQNGDGESYADYGYELENLNGLTVFKVSDGCGGSYKIILKDSNRVKI